MMDDVSTTVAAVEVVMPRLPRAASDAAFSVMMLDAQDIEGRTRVDQALSQVPGVSLFRRNASVPANPTTQGISLRSIAPSGAGRALVTLDGVPQNDPFGGWVIWAGIPPELIDRIDVVRGGGAGPYGAGALTGVIDLYERAHQGMEVDVRGGSLDTSRGAVVAETEIGAVDLLAGGSMGRTGGYIPVREHRGAADTPLTEQDWNGALRLTGGVGDSRVSLRVSAFDEKHGSGLAGANSRAEGQAASLSLARGPTPDRIGYRLQAWVRDSNLENTSVAVSANRATTTPANNQYKTPATGYGFNGAIRGGDSSHEWEVGADARFVDGEERELFSAPAGFFTKNRVAGGKTSVAGLYAEGTLKQADWLFTGGARIDRWTTTDSHRVETLLATGAVTLNQPTPDRDGWLPTGRLGARYQFTEAAYWRAATYVGFRPPTLNELHRPFRVGNDITEANTALEPERLYGGETAVGWAAGNTTLEGAVFFNRLEDAVTNVTIGIGAGKPIAGFEGAGVIPVGGVLRQRRNAGTIDAWGLEAQAEQKISDTLSFQAAGSYTVAEVDGGTKNPQLTGLAPAQAPRTTLTAGIYWKPVAKLSVDLRGRYESSRYEDDLNTRKLHAAGTVDARVGWKFTDSVEVYATGENLLDEAVQTGQTADGVYSYGAPRTVMVGLNLRR